MNLRSKRPLQATGKSVFVAVIFCIASGASTLAGGHLADGETARVTVEATGEPWLEKEQGKPRERLLCLI